MKKIIALTLLWVSMAAPLTARAELTKPDVLVNNIAQEVLTIVRQDRDAKDANREYILEQLKAKVLPNFDFERMTQLAVGKHWRHATPEQKKTLVVEFRNLLVNSYANTFSRFSNQTVKVRPVELPSGADEVTIKTFILKPGEQPVTVNYEMEKTAEGWKVFDLTVEGVSLVITYRSTFSRQVKMGGIAGLIKTLVEKNAANNASRLRAIK